ncbi:MAG: hypothetical protein ACI388_07920 [Methanobrevibacter sp.]|uniref:hypothetical protein n=1 Tax=Methanobrevibacter sp. TaxID=66852 RepID=UPI002A5FC9DA|nr:hypothetical protein [Turicibacter sp.]
MFKYKSKVGKGSSKFDSARLIIPQQVRKFLEIDPGDTVTWEVNIDETGTTVTIKKAE